MIRELDFRYVVVRNGADYGFLNPLTSPTIRCDSDSEIKTSLSGTFLANPDVNWLSDQIRAEIIIDGTVYPLGMYLPATVTTNMDSTTTSVNVEAYDRCWLLKDNRTDSTLYFEAGTNYLTAVKQLLTDAGVTLVSETPTAATLAEDREDWEIGTSYLEIVNQLLSEINYNQIWFDNRGLAILEPTSVPTAENIDHVIDSDDIKSLVYPELYRQMDIYSSPNVFVVLCSNADKSAPLVARSENVNPQSPLSIVRRGRRIVTVERVDNIASQEELDAYAERLRNESMITGETIEVKTGLFPEYGVGDVTALKYGDSVFAVCAERAWEMELEVGGVMKHTLEKVVINLG